MKVTIKSNVELSKREVSNGFIYELKLLEYFNFYSVKVFAKNEEDLVDELIRLNFKELLQVEDDEILTILISDVGSNYFKYDIKSDVKKVISLEEFTELSQFCYVVNCEEFIILKNIFSLNKKDLKLIEEKEYNTSFSIGSNNIQNTTNYHYYLKYFDIFKSERISGTLLNIINKYLK